jgi:xanthine dehydrogenase YagR molybdenum-binding subunit
MFSLPHRPTTRQRVAIGATLDGRLAGIVHEALSETSRFEDYTETILLWSGLLYKYDNVTLEYKVAALDVNTPGAARPDPPREPRSRLAGREDIAVVGRHRS